MRLYVDDKDVEMLKQALNDLAYIAEDHEEAKRVRHLYNRVVRCEQLQRNNKHSGGATA